ncbi:MAG: 4-hydroxy-3-methylbut-2-en-1-yl diphosphate synthase [Spirochaetales bacterium]|nr:4-hydroxy-3-methylbut-2-en-1-yl diphosphate synthase [Spirochaetales bacterium]
MARHFALSTIVDVGGLAFGGDHPVRVQTMWKDPLQASTLNDTARKIEILASYGCEVLRFAVPDEESAHLLCGLQGLVSIPLVADIHFDHTLALICLGTIPKIRINPGNIGSKIKIKEVVKKASDYGAALRVGINAGSLPRALRAEKDSARAMLRAAEDELDNLESLHFHNVLFSLKSSDIKTTIRANELFAERYNYPLHLGVTEAGPPIQGVVKNTAALVPLLNHGIGATVRVSLSGTCEDELVAGREILAAAGRSTAGVNVVSCPRCARAGFDVHGFLAEVQEFLMTINLRLNVAVMGCIVNGPEEARHADIGITGAGKKALVFREGKIIRRVTFESAAEVFREEITKLCQEKGAVQ